jgi:phospholipid/cholesterol/gamma-HCH transport system ATP-binding protein
MSPATLPRSPSAGPAAQLRHALEAVMALDVAAVSRLQHAHASVRFDTGEDAVTVRFDRAVPEVTNGDTVADIAIELTDAQTTALAEGHLPLTAAIVSGAVAYHGPIRKYLEVEPILRGLLAQVAGNDEAHSAANGASTTTATPQADLLAIETRALHKSFGPHHVLRGLDLTVPEGVISVVLGPSGTGKSVLLQHMLGLLAPDSGDVLIRGVPLSSMSRSELLVLRREIGVMFQDGALFSAMNLYDNVAFPLRQHTNLEEGPIREIVSEHLDGVGLTSAAHRMPNELSGGMKKRAGLARALVLNPGIVLCDEPDSGLDPVRTSLLGELLIERHAQYGGTMLVVTHNVLLAKEISDHISVLWQGEVLEAGMSAAVLESKTAFVRQFLAGEPEGPLGMDA